MTVSRKTELGEIKINDQIVEDLIMDIITSDEMRRKVWPAPSKGHKIGRLTGIHDPGADLDLISDTDEEGLVSIEFSVIVRFGISIKKTTRILADELADSMKYTLGVRPSVITINIAGVKSKLIAKRRTRTIYRYEADS